jgi:hypothetical protein
MRDRGARSELGVTGPRDPRPHEQRGGSVEGPSGPSRERLRRVAIIGTMA